MNDFNEEDGAGQRGNGFAYAEFEVVHKPNIEAKCLRRIPKNISGIVTK